jgi:hypothetical protein
MTECLIFLKKFGRLTISIALQLDGGIVTPVFLGGKQLSSFLQVQTHFSTEFDASKIRW